MKKILLILILLSVSIAQAHPINSDELISLGAGTKLVVTKDINLPANVERHVIFASKREYIGNYDSNYDYYKQKMCFLSFSDKPVAEYDRVINSGDKLSIISINLQDKDLTAEDLRMFHKLINNPVNIDTVECKTGPGVSLQESIDTCVSPTKVRTLDATRATHSVYQINAITNKGTKVELECLTEKISEWTPSDWHSWTTRGGYYKFTIGDLSEGIKGKLKIELAQPQIQ